MEQDLAIRMLARLKACAEGDVAAVSFSQAGASALYGLIVHYVNQSGRIIRRLDEQDMAISVRRKKGGR